MKALCWHGPRNVHLDDVPEPTIVDGSDIVVRITRTAICGSDLHLFNGLIPAMADGDILGHEFMGIVVAKGSDVRKLHLGDLVVVPFTISCGSCSFCNHHLYALCDRTNPDHERQRSLHGTTTAGLFGYSHVYGGYPGGQAEFARVPHADVGAIRVPEGVADDSALFLSDILPTAWMAASNADIRPGSTVAIWGCGPVGLLAIRCAWLQGAGRVIAIDRIPERLAMAREKCLAETIDYSACDEGVVERLRDMLDGLGPESCIDAVGMEAHGTSLGEIYDYVKQALHLETDRPTVLRQAILSCRKGGTLSVPGVYGGAIDRIPFGTAFAKGLTFRMGQTHVQRYMPMLMERIVRGDIDPSFIISHRLPLGQAEEAYDLFSKRDDRCIKVVLSPDAPTIENLASARRQENPWTQSRIPQPSSPD